MKPNYRNTALHLFVVFAISLFAISTAYAQKHYTIGISQWVESEDFEKNITAFKKELSENGFIEGKNITFIQKNAHANKGIQRAIINKFVRDGVDMIYSLTTPGTLIAKELAPNIPIVFSIVTSPVEAGLIESLESSENNLVGTRNYLPPARQFYYFDQVSPGTKILAFAFRKGEINSAIQYKEFQETLRRRNIKLKKIEAVNITELERELNKNIHKVDAIFAACDTLIQSGGEKTIVQIALKHKVPTFSCNKSGVINGALIGNVADVESLGKISGTKASTVLKGTLPEDIPTESPRDDYVVLNSATLKHLGLKVPAKLNKKISQIVEK